MDITNTIAAITAIAALITAVLGARTVREMKAQRIQSYAPQIVLDPEQPLFYLFRKKRYYP